MTDNKYALKLTLATGESFEAHGPLDFVLGQKQEFLSLSSGQTAAKQKINGNIWGKIADTNRNTAVLKTKPAGITAQTAAILIMAAGKELLGILDYSALELSKSLKKSGYIKGRLDRILAAEIKNKTVISGGTKRNRMYKLTETGLAKAHNILQNIK